MNRRCLAWVAVPLALALAGCGSPLDDEWHTESDPSVAGATGGERRSEQTAPSTPEPSTTSTPSASRDAGKPTSSATEPAGSSESNPATPSTRDPASSSKSNLQDSNRQTSTPAKAPQASKTSKPQPEKSSKSEAPPAMAKGSPLDIPTFAVTGVPYAENRDYIEGEIARACGGSRCVAVKLVYSPGTPESENCTVDTIDQPKPIYAGDTITFTLGEPCEDVDVQTEQVDPTVDEAES